MQHGSFYNVVIPVIGIMASIGAIWAGHKIDKAKKEGNIIYYDKVHVDSFWSWKRKK